MRDTQLITYTVDKLLKDGYFRRGICSISSACSGGGGSASWGGITGTITAQTDLVNYISAQLGTVDLQSVTTGTNNNKTTNAIHQGGIDGLDPTFDGISIYSAPGTAGVIANFATNGVLRFEPLKTTVGVFNIALVLNQNQDSSLAGAQFNNARVQGSNAINTDEFVTLGQVQNSLLNNVVVPALLPTPEIIPNTVYTYTNLEDAANWTLPVISGNTGTRIVIINFSTENVNLLSNGGGNDIVENGVGMSTFSILSGQTKVLFNNSLAWVFLT